MRSFPFFLQADRRQKSPLMQKTASGGIVLFKRRADPGTSSCKKNGSKRDAVSSGGTHEAIIDRETFAKAQSLFNQFACPAKRDKDLFSAGR